MIRLGRTMICGVEMALATAPPVEPEEHCG